MRTNNPVGGAFRGFGANQAQFAMEGVLDRLAELVGISGWEIRKRNVILTARDMQGYNLILAELQALHAHDFTAQASEADDAQNTEAVVSDATQAAIEEMKRAA